MKIQIVKVNLRPSDQIRVLRATISSSKRFPEPDFVKTWNAIVCGSSGIESIQQAVEIMNRDSNWRVELLEPELEVSFFGN